MESFKTVLLKSIRIKGNLLLVLIIKQETGLVLIVFVPRERIAMVSAE